MCEDHLSLLSTQTPSTLSEENWFPVESLDICARRDVCLPSFREVDELVLFGAKAAVNKENLHCTTVRRASRCG